jgi:thiol-disulfide isomerase/thioredoxin
MAFTRLFYRVSFVLLALASVAGAQTIIGRWDGTAKIADNFTVPVHLEISGAGSHVQGALINGAQRLPATAGDIGGDSLRLNFAQYAVTLQATLQDGALRGTYAKDDGTFAYPFELRPHQPEAPASGKAPDIAGVWIIPTDSPKGERAWRLVVHQIGPHVSATVLRVDGDTGTLAGSYQNGKFALSHFADVRPALLDITPAPDGTLDLVLYGTHINAGKNVPFVRLTAVRASQAKLKNVAAPDDFSQHTSVRDPNVPFRFSFPDIHGKLVSNTDPQFKNKVILVNITGSWCPNCHDEAPYLAELYRKYHAQGLEIVALDFEEPSQEQSLSRLHSFIKKYDIGYTYLIAGDPKEVNAKIPQAVNLNAWPTSFFIGRDGLVHAVETGFPSPGSPEFQKDVEQRYVSVIQHLLAQGLLAQRSLPANRKGL